MTANPAESAEPVYWGLDLARPFSDISIIQSPYATREHWNFRPSRYRSRRLHKKLVKKFGGQVVIVPAIYMINSNTAVAHPDIVAAIAAAPAYATPAAPQKP